MSNEDENDPLYQIAIAVEHDATLNAEMQEWREELAADGIRGAKAAGGKSPSARRCLANIPRDSPEGMKSQRDAPPCSSLQEN